MAGENHALEEFARQNFTGDMVSLFLKAAERVIASPSDFHRFPHIAKVENKEDLVTRLMNCHGGDAEEFAVVQRLLELHNLHHAV
ncbi:hypothetical protein L0Y69_01125 [bacterium]|nr:hypothetical protein [bacterium]